MDGLFDCRDCELCLSRSSSPVPGYGNHLSPIFVLGEAPGRQEDEEGIPFVGRAGRELARRLWDAGFNLDSLYRTNAVKCWPGPGDPKPRVKHISACRKWLIQELEEVKPRVILALGAIAIRAALGVRKQVGVRGLRGIPIPTSIIVPVPVLVFPTYHPSAVLRSPRLTSLFIKDLETLRGMIMVPPPIPTPASPTSELSPLYVLVRDVVLPPDVTVIAVDTETDSQGRLWCVQFSYRVGEAWVVKADNLDNIKYIFNHYDPDLTVVFHNAAFDLEVLTRAGIGNVRAKIEDTMVIAYAMGEEELGLKRLARQYCGMEMQEYKDITEGKGIEEVDHGKAILYAAKDADATLRLFRELEHRMDARSRGVYELDMGALPMTVAMRLNGMPVDEDELLKLGREMEERREVAEIGVWVAADREFNLGSPRQVSEVLYGDLGLRTGRKTDTGMFSTDDNELSRLSGQHPIIGLLQEYRELDKMIGSFVIPLLRNAGDSAGSRAHRVYCDLRIAGTVSGRMAASGPNLMAIPVRGEWGKRIRDCFVAKDGYRFMSLDLAQIDMRVLAYVSQDSGLVEAFHHERDVHGEAAASLFGPSFTSDQRYIAKRVGFGMVNGIEASGLRRELKREAGVELTQRQAQGYLNAYWVAHPGVARHTEEVITFAKRNGYAEDMFGRRRALPEIKSGDVRVAREAEKKAISFPVQSATAGIVKHQMREVWELIKVMGWGKDVLPLLQIHDDLLFEVRDDMLGMVAGAMQTVMEEVIKLKEGPFSTPLSVPIVVEVKAGKRWGSMGNGK